MYPKVALTDRDNLSHPHTFGQKALLVAHHISVDRCGLNVCVSQPFLNKVQWNTRLRAAHPERVSQGFWHGGAGHNSRSPHDGTYALPSGRAAPTPDAQLIQGWV